MVSGGNLLLAGTGITPKARTDMALWGIMRPEGPCCFEEPSALCSRARGDEGQTIREEGSTIRSPGVAWPPRREDPQDLYQ